MSGGKGSASCYDSTERNSKSTCKHSPSVGVELDIESDGSVDAVVVVCTVGVEIGRWCVPRKLSVSSFSALAYRDDGRELARLLRLRDSMGCGRKDRRKTCG